VRGAALGVLAALAVVALTATSTHARPLAAGCGSVYRGLRTLSDPQRNLVNLQPKDTTLAAIAQLARPAVTPTRRNTAFERQVWRVPAQITAFKLEPDGDIQLVLFDPPTYGIAAMPAAACVPKTARARQAIINARQRFVAACGQPTSSSKPLGAVVNISGVGFWDKPHTQNPHAPNFAELHPVTDLQIVAGCK
jgi:hypothetical protein